MTDQTRQLQQAARAFRDRFDTVLLATASAQGIPEISYAPYLLDEAECICIYVSELAAHTGNLVRQPRASLMFIADEKESRNPFARERLVLHCRAEAVTGEAAAAILQGMEDKFGRTVELLRSLPDFHLFRFHVEEGSYVRGFGQAWALEGNGLAIRELKRG